jgi:uncharacterized protein YukE
MELEAAGHQASLLQSQAVEELASVISGSDALVKQLAGVWHGTDADRFVGAWETTHKTALTRVQQALADFHDELVRNIRAQQETSAG